MLGFGIDLAGYSTGKTALAALEINGRIAKATLLCGSNLSAKRRGEESIDAVVKGDVEVLNRCLRLGPVAIDVPIDLQGLPNPSNPKTVWALTRRPVDRALKAMPPFADRIGAPVARFSAIMRVGHFAGFLGHSLFESYPAANYKKLGIKAGHYKTSQDARVVLCNALKIAEQLDNDDDIDAISCALTANATPDQLCDVNDLAEMSTVRRIDGPLPDGYRILKKQACDTIEVERKDFNGWMAAREPKA